MSVVATTLNLITFMSILAKTYASDWRFIIGQYRAIAILPLVFYFCVPFFRQFTNIPKRVLMYVVDCLPACLFIGCIAIITYLTVLALRPFTETEPVVLVLLISVLCIVCAWMRGIEGVIWTDVLQGLLLSGSAILVFVVICFKLQGGN